MTAALFMILLLQDKPPLDPITRERTSLLRHSIKPHAAIGTGLRATARSEVTMASAALA